jgi:hypothetical protein
MSANDERIPSIFLRDWVRRAQTEPKQLVQWVTSSFDCAHRLATEADPSVELVSAFWIRLYGCLREVHEWVEELHQGLCEGAAADDVRFEYVEKTQTTLSNLRTAFDDDSLMWIEYMRHTHAHPAPSAYYRSLDNLKKVTIQSHMLLRVVPIADFQNAFDRVLERTKGNETTLAIAFAARCLTPLMQLKFDVQSVAAVVT